MTHLRIHFQIILLILTIQNILESQNLKVTAARAMLYPQLLCLKPGLITNMKKRCQNIFQRYKFNICLKSFKIFHLY